MTVADFSFEEVGEILRALERLDCTSVSLECGDLKLEVRRGPAAASDAQHPVEPVPAVAEPLPSPINTEPVNTEPITAEATDTPAHWVAVTAPMVGTFYRSPGPGEPPFIEPGDTVEPGRTIGLIEVMKLFTELEAEVTGKIARIEAADTSLVESGQTLIWIEPS